MKDVKAPVFAWVGYLVVLAASVAVAKLAPGTLGHAFSLLCAFVMAGFIVTFFMGLRSADNLLRVFALAGMMWLAFMITLTLADYFYRDIEQQDLLRQESPGVMSLEPDTMRDSEQ
ncbi:cytochrome C oxidase subunit IV family protein [Halomonas sp. WWR20]